MRVKTLSSIAVLSALSIVIASCGSYGSPVEPSHTTRAGLAVIIGQVMGMSTTTQRPGASSSAGTTAALTFSQNASTTLTVSISGTNISTNVDGNGRFELKGVPPGDVTMNFSGAGVSSSITLKDVSPSSQVTVIVKLNGTSAHLESQERDEDDELDDDDDEDEDGDEVEGIVSNKFGGCPTLMFTVQGITVHTNEKTEFEHGPCSSIANGTRVEVEGTRQGNTIEAKEVEIKNK